MDFGYLSINFRIANSIKLLFVFYRYLHKYWVYKHEIEGTPTIFSNACYIHIVGVDCVIVDRGKYMYALGGNHTVRYS